MAEGSGTREALSQLRAEIENPPANFAGRRDLILRIGKALKQVAHSSDREELNKLFLKAERLLH